MKHANLLKLVPIAAIAVGVYSTGALAGGTNRSDNTAATPGPKATTTTTPAQGIVGREDMRRGTTRTKNMDTPQSASDVGNGSSGGTGTYDKSMKHKGASGSSGQNSGEGSTPENADSGYDATTGNSSGSSTGAKDSGM
ncbi:MAG TPA: hypothetical protein VFS17_01000 [Methylophilaceae bacterium]|nr:hypothetical protein [Methylophilaceae bacterium]